jgi:multiple sugar transport system substrate-binding protein
MGTDAPLSDISEDKIVDFETAVMMVPQFDTDNPQMISQGPSVCIFNKEDSGEVLASWLFVQYLLTNDVQIAYAETEGYVPVTEKAQQSAEYQDYLSRSGEDNSTYYEVKLEATQLLLDHVDDTFVTPVFNGSASLRDAAGQLIENTVKSVRRGQTVDDAYIDQLYDDVTSLYRLDQLESSGNSAASGETDLGPLPKTSVILLASLAVAWVLILLYVGASFIKTKRNQK